MNDIFDVIEVRHAIARFAGQRRRQVGRAVIRVVAAQDTFLLWLDAVSSWYCFTLRAS